MTLMTLWPWPLTRAPRTGHPVRSLQCLLRADGYDIAADGVFGPPTEAAVRAFQSRRGLDVDGSVGPNTWRALVVTVRRGDKGEAVRAVQEDLARRDPTSPAPIFAIDGLFGPVTDFHVRGFQGKVGLVEDGVVGPRTWQALMSGTGAD